MYNEVTKRYYFVTKGAFESIRSGLDNGDGLKNATDFVNESTRTGARVLALAYRELSELEVDSI